jgi:hypothetical protein
MENIATFIGTVLGFSMSILNLLFIGGLAIPLLGNLCIKYYKKIARL